MLLPALVLVLSAKPPTLVAPGLRCADFSQAVCDAFGDHLVQQLTARGLQVTSAADIAASLGLERQRQLMGCSDVANSCLAEMTAALGADAIVLGSIAKVGGGVLLNVRIVNGAKANVLATFSESLPSEAVVASSLERAAQRLAEGLTQHSSDAAKPGGRAWAILPASLAVAAGIGAAVSFGVSSTEAARLRGLTPLPAGFDANQAVSTGKTTQTVAAVLTGVAGAGAAAAVIIFLVAGAPPSTSAGLVPTRDGVAVTFTGAFP